MIVILQANDCGAKIHKKLYTAMLVIIYFVEESKKTGNFVFLYQSNSGSWKSFVELLPLMRI
jgi:hypothetical protein